jgi:hypothetical protein
VAEAVHPNGSSETHSPPSPLVFFTAGSAACSLSCSRYKSVGLTVITVHSTSTVEPSSVVLTLQTPTPLCSVLFSDPAPDWQDLFLVMCLHCLHLFSFHISSVPPVHFHPYFLPSSLVMSSLSFPPDPELWPRYDVTLPFLHSKNYLKLPYIEYLLTIFLSLLPPRH